MNSDIATTIPREDARQGVARRPWRIFAVQLLVVGVGLLFTFALAPGLVEDVDQMEPDGPAA